MNYPLAGFILGSLSLVGGVVVWVVGRLLDNRKEMIELRMKVGFLEQRIDDLEGEAKELRGKL